VEGAERHVGADAPQYVESAWSQDDSCDSDGFLRLVMSRKTHSDRVLTFDVLGGASTHSYISPRYSRPVSLHQCLRL
jgi:hypothetical protein